jgi:GR25 family glycosyltransferase involved in LPS biosynthesis
MNIKVISLKRRQDRRTKFTKTFSPYFDFEFVDAVDGLEYKLTKEDEKMIEGNKYHTQQIHIPSLVCANKMHMRLYEECIASNTPYVIIEDDADLMKPIDFSFKKILDRKDLDAFWLVPDTFSILAYIIWPEGAKKLLKFIEKNRLPEGLDIMYGGIKNKGILKEDQLNSKYFKQYPGVDSDITPLPFYGYDEKTFNKLLTIQKPNLI